MTSYLAYCEAKKEAILSSDPYCSCSGCMTIAHDELKQELRTNPDIDYLR